MKTYQTPADAYQFRCRADREREIDLDSHYRMLGNTDVVAALTPNRKAGTPARRNLEPVEHDC